MLFQLGTLVATPGALELLNNNRLGANVLINRHAQGDWGNVCADDAAANTAAIADRDGIHSSYSVGQGTIWIITDTGHLVTTLLVPDEY